MLDESKTAFEGLDNLMNKLIRYGQLIDVEEEQAKAYLLNLERTFDTEYMAFLKAFTEITGKKVDGDIDSRDLFYSNQIHSLQEKIKALKNAADSQWLKDHNYALTPAFILKKENITKYMNYTATNNNTNTLNPADGNQNTYAEIQNI